MDDISTVDRHVGKMDACRVIATRIQSLLDKLDESRPEGAMLSLLLGFIEGYQDGERVKLEGQLRSLGDFEQYLKAQQAKDAAGEDKRTITVGQEANWRGCFTSWGAAMPQAIYCASCSPPAATETMTPSKSVWCKSMLPNIMAPLLQL